MTKDEAIKVLENRLSQCRYVHDTATSPDISYPGVCREISALEIALAVLRPTPDGEPLGAKPVPSWFQDFCTTPDGGTCNQVAKNLQPDCNQNRVLTMNEAIMFSNQKFFIFYEKRGSEELVPLSHIFTTQRGRKEYLKTWRCWLFKPTGAEREAVAWDD